MPTWPCPGAIQDANGLRLIPQASAAGAGRQRAAAGGALRAPGSCPWLGLLGLLVAALGALLPAAGARAPCSWGLLGFAGAAGHRLHHRCARGWSFDALTASPRRAGRAAALHGLGGFVALDGAAHARGVRRGAARGSSRAICSRPAACVLGCGSLLALFIVFPVLKSVRSFLSLSGGRRLCNRRHRGPRGQRLISAWAA